MDSTTQQLILAVAVLWPIAFFAFKGKTRPRKLLPARYVVAILLFAISSGGSIIWSLSPITSVSYLLMTLGAMYLAREFNLNSDAEQFKTGLQLYAALMAVSLIYVIQQNYDGDRLWIKAAGYNPNSLALVVMSVILSALSFRNLLYRSAVLASPLLTMALTNSRASAVGTTIGIAVVLLLQLKGATKSAKPALWSCIALAAVVATYFRHEIAGQVQLFLRLDDVYRGIGTGATGRSEAWRETWSLFLQHPFFGVGFRAHEARLTVGSSSHNGYLALLAEIGLVGFAAVMYLVISGILGLYRLGNEQARSHASSILLGLMIGYMIVSLFERYMLNVGNPTSLLFILAIVTGCSYRSLDVRRKLMSDAAVIKHTARTPENLLQ